MPTFRVTMIRHNQQLSLKMSICALVQSGVELLMFIGHMKTFTSSAQSYLSIYIILLYVYFFFLRQVTDTMDIGMICFC